MDNSDPLKRIEVWKGNLKDSMDEHVSLALKAESNLSESEIKELWFLNKLATLLVGSEELGKQIRGLEEKFDAIST